MSGPCGTGVGRSVLRCSWAAAGSRAQVWPWAWRRSPSGRTEWEHIRWCPWLEHLLRPPATSASGCDRSSRMLCGELFYGPPPGGLDLQGNRNKATTVHHTRYENVKWEQCSVVGPETDLRGGPAGGDRLFGGPGCSFALWSHKTRRLQSSEPSPGRSWPRPQTLREPSREPAAAGHQTWPLCAEVCPPRYCCWAHWPLHLHEKNTEVTLLLGLFVSALPSIHPSIRPPHLWGWAAWHSAQPARWRSSAAACVRSATGCWLLPREPEAERQSRCWRPRRPRAAASSHWASGWQLHHSEGAPVLIPESCTSHRREGPSPRTSPVCSLAANNLQISQPIMFKGPINHFFKEKRRALTLVFSLYLCTSFSFYKSKTLTKKKILGR